MAEKLWVHPELAGAYNFGPLKNEVVTVKDVIELARKFYSRGTVHYQNNMTGPHEAGLLVLETSKVRHTLGVEPSLILSQAIEITMDWYRSQTSGSMPLSFAKMTFLFTRRLLEHSNCKKFATCRRLKLIERRRLGMPVAFFLAFFARLN